MDHNLNSFKDHLHSLHESWEEVSKQSSLVNNDEFMLKLAKEIQEIHDDITQSHITGEFKENAEIIDYIFQTPWGAPFVFDKPLLEAARSYLQKNPNDLKKLIGEFLNYKEEINEQLFDCIQEIENKICKDE